MFFLLISFTLLVIAQECKNPDLQTNNFEMQKAIEKLTEWIVKKEGFINFHRIEVRQTPTGTGVFISEYVIP